MITIIHEAMNNHPGMSHQSTLFSSTQEMIPSGTSSNLILCKILPYDINNFHITQNMVCLKVLLDSLILQTIHSNIK